MMISKKIKQNENEKCALKQILFQYVQNTLFNVIFIVYTLVKFEII
jgi:hypothetical protein